MTITISIDELEDMLRYSLCYDAHMDDESAGIIAIYPADSDDPNHGIEVYLHIREPDEPVENEDEYFTVYRIEREVNDSAVEDYSRKEVDMSHVSSLSCLKELIQKTITVRPDSKDQQAELDK